MKVFKEDLEVHYLLIKLTSHFLFNVIESIVSRYLFFFFFMLTGVFLFM